MALFNPSTHWVATLGILLLLTSCGGQTSETSVSSETSQNMPRALYEDNLDQKTISDPNVPEGSPESTATCFDNPIQIPMGYKLIACGDSQQGYGPWNFGVSIYNFDYTLKHKMILLGNDGSLFTTEDPLILEASQTPQYTFIKRSYEPGPDQLASHYFQAPHFESLGPSAYVDVIGFSNMIWSGTNSEHFSFFYTVRNLTTSETKVSAIFFSNAEMTIDLKPGAVVMVLQECTEADYASQIAEVENLRAQIDDINQQLFTAYLDFIHASMSYETYLTVVNELEALRDTLITQLHTTQLGPCPLALD